MAKTKLTPDVRSKIEYVASIDGTVEEMAYYCDVSRQTIYNWLDKESDFFDKKLALKVEKLRANPVLKARQTVVQSLNDPVHAFKYLEKKRKKEFGNNLDITTDGKEITNTVLIAEATKALDELT
jgi:DNA-binding XRE family transcriptional regulator